jgi:hypothetical protein
MSMAQLHLSKLIHLAAVAAAMCLTQACAVPAEVEGIVRGEEFVVRDPRPAAKATAAGRDAYLVLSQNDGETLRTVTVRLPNIASLPLEQDIAVGTGVDDDADAPFVQVAEGELEVTTRADGAEILSATDPTFAQSVTGTLRLTSKDGEIAGTFAIDLDDGGWLDATFVVDAPAS